ncbi:MAG: F0F1 ATP synthase subunit A [Dysgonamonadaceae bacterium]|jgi:F-type H+-transporting ATPase subunit a|nr:F0F1 ATP synthase subunit A [Dysgonamonadaceae bacterium]
MKHIKYILFAIALLTPLSTTLANEAEGKTEKISPKDIIFEHVLDAYSWHIFTAGGHHISLPLPIIVKGQNGWAVFSSSKLAHGAAYNGFFLSPETGKVVEEINGKEIRPLDLSLTKNACSILLVCILLSALFISLANSYRKDPYAGRKGFAGAMEMLFLFIYDDLIKPCVGKDYKKFAPYLLTVFFFIFFNNLLGLFPLFPGGANVTGNIAVTLVLALITFTITNVFGTKEYWKEIFWPDVPAWLKVPLPIMPLIEFIGIFTKPFALMMRLFANMLSGHMIVLVLVTLIFIFTSLMGAIAGSGVAVVSVLFSLFMLMLDVLVSFIQAYVFTMLSSIFIGMARVEPHLSKH